MAQSSTYAPHSRTNNPIYKLVQPSSEKGYFIYWYSWGGSHKINVDTQLIPQNLNKYILGDPAQTPPASQSWGVSCAIYQSDFSSKLETESITIWD
ncbi:MAG: hypothetical protein OER04_09305 [Cyclobacteriaceae bacterium]|nr:hypothetical protein [Cyclobacteriaceae bacterium]